MIRAFKVWTPIEPGTLWEMYRKDSAYKGKTKYHDDDENDSNNNNDNNTNNNHHHHHHHHQKIYFIKLFSN